MPTDPHKQDTLNFAVLYARQHVAPNYGPDDEPTPYERGLIHQVAAHYRDGYLAACELWEARLRAADIARQQLEQERDKYRLALERHLCPYDLADWLACIGHPESECEVCNDRGPHWHQLQAAEQAQATRIAALQRIIEEMRNERSRYKSHDLGYTDSVSSNNVDEWADELAALLPPEPK